VERLQKQLEEEKQAREAMQARLDQLAQQVGRNMEVQPPPAPPAPLNAHGAAQGHTVQSPIAPPLAHGAAQGTGFQHTPPAPSPAHGAAQGTGIQQPPTALPTTRDAQQ